MPGYATAGYSLCGVVKLPASGIRPAGETEPAHGKDHTMSVYVTYDVPADLEDDAIEALEVARDTGTVKKGTNETTKAVERGNASLVYIAEDVSPEEIVMHLPELADEKEIPFVFVETQDDVGHAAGLEVGSAAAAIVDAGDADEQVEEITSTVEDLR
jgi:large subunit ribosomal protein L7Ae